ncbi:hypothetical protein [Niabella hibiscisoli]|uniref:hypothetical protein n=1 Tax=Niabella hibiscisoli TaxID=1825928 RepID=UPI001F115D43|nr:hypothetical protein [Niabella hibiscisoli]MCH5714972.1 hypothetical protein [Niabella hibiscisoli]
MKAFIVLILCMTTGSAFSQADFVKLVNDYFRVDPFEGAFPIFYNSLKNDRSLLNKEFNRSENGSSLDISGNYKIFNPFGINANSIKVGLRNEGLITYYSRQVPVYAYEITGVFTDSKYVRAKVMNEIWLISNRMRRLYVNSKKTVLRKRDIVEDEDVIKFWFKNLTLFKAMELSWNPLTNSGEIQLKLQCYFIVINDYAYPLGHYPGRSSDQFNDLENWRKY